MSNFYRLVTDAIEHNKMLCRGDCVIVALSGGADSVSLIHFLMNIKEDYDLKIIACHVNHNLRGDESNRDEEFVNKLCSNYNIPLFIKSVNVKTLSQQQKISEELCGRNVRYDFFKELSTLHNGKIATAHTASDNAETLIFNLVRGAGLKGMTGIAPVRDNIIRPLIYVTREQVEQYCLENSLKFVTDSSNLTDDFTRNKIRHKIVPLLKEINGDFENTATRHSKIFSGINTFMSQEVNTAIFNAKVKDGYNSTFLYNLPSGLKSAVIYTLCKEIGVDAEHCHIQKICNILATSGAVDLPCNIRCVVKQNLLRFVEAKECSKEYFEVPFELHKSFSFNGNNYSVKELKNENKDLIDLSYLKDDLVFRTRKGGDVFTFPYRKGTKTIKKLFNELKIPQEKRDSILLLAKDNVILWIEGIGVSKQGKSKSKGGICIVKNAE